MWDAMLQLRRRVAAEGGASLLVRDDDGDHTVGDLLGLADRLRGRLAGHVGARPTIAVEAGNEWRPVVPALAVAELGGTLALLSPKMSADEARMAFEDLGPDAVVCSAEAGCALGACGRRADRRRRLGDRACTWVDRGRRRATPASAGVPAS